MPKVKKSFKQESIDPHLFNTKKLIYSCEDCSFFILKPASCEIGLNTELHRKKEQNLLYNRSGKLNICLFLEIT